MKSMTGFGRGNASGEEFELVVEVSSVNKKGLEVSCSIPRTWARFEALAGGIVREFYTRAKVNVSVRLVKRVSETNPLGMDVEKLRAAVEFLRNTSESIGVAFAPDANLLLKLNEALSQAEQPSENGGDIPEYASAFEKALREALSEADKMRVAEGANIVADFVLRLSSIEKTVASVQKLSSENCTRYKEALLRRLEALGTVVDVSDERVLREIAIFVDKSDISEECTRLRSHIDQFGNLIAKSAPCGRMLDFICQEMGREANTIASKANFIEITKAAMSIKNEVERLREQVQNVE